VTTAFAVQWLRWSIVAAFIASVIFFAGATLIFPWWRQPIGRALVLIDVFWSVTLLPPFLVEIRVLGGRQLFFIAYYAVSLCATAVLTLWRLWAIAKIQRQGRKANGQG
jgi:hypothetical protein